MSEIASYEELKNKAADFDRLMADYRLVQDEVNRLKETAEKNDLQLESTIEHSNRVTMEAQIAYLELKQVFNASSD